MCGIAGLIGSRLSAPELTIIAERMQFALRLRGPDDAGVFLDSNQGVMLAHTRLAILDLSLAGRQPMRSMDGRYTIVFNGEVYNFRALRRELQEQGVRFVSQTDTEVILALFQQHGPACVHELEGMFAFCIWDEQEHTAFLVRDAFGIKPLYYRDSDATLLFASEVKALLAAEQFSPRLSAEALFSYWLMGTVQEPLTMLDEVTVLPAGHYLTWKAGKTHIRRYWEPQLIGEGIEPEAACSITRAALEESILRHLVSDVPVGVFLSGGIDSTALVALARAAGKTNLHTYSITFPDSANDEGLLARRSAAHFGTTHHEWPLGAVEGQTLFRQFLGAMDQPSIDGLNTFTVSKFARDQGMKVVLSGLGGDELFGGYDSFRVIPRLIYAGQWAGLVPLLSQSLGWAISALSTSSRLDRLGCYLMGRPGEMTAYWCMRGIFNPSEAAALTRHFLGAAPVVEEAMYHMQIPQQPQMEDSVSYMELTCYLRNQLLRDADVMSMASGLELRTPFVDRKLYEVLRYIPAATRLRPGKQLLLEAVPEIPPWIAHQPKRGFLFPFEQWLGTEWRETFTALDQRSPVPLQTWYRKWAVFTLPHWLERSGFSVPA